MRTSASLLAVLMLTLAQVGCATSTNAHRTAAARHDARLAHMHALAGAWSTGTGGPPMQETWMPPRGQNMTGVLRWYRADGTVRMYELMTITAEPDAVRLRIRHFDAEMNPWASESEGPMVLTLADSNPNRPGLITFIAEQRCGSVASITYDTNDPGMLLAELRFNDGSPTTTIPFERLD